MRLPFLEKDPTKITEIKAISMTRKAIDKGVEYLDTAWLYHELFKEILDDFDWDFVQIQLN